MTQVAEKTSPLIAALDQRPQGGPRWLDDLRARGAARFSALGIPTVREEEWRFTSVAPIAATEFRAAPTLSPSSVELGSLIFADAPVRIAFLNGRFSPELSRTQGLPRGVRLASLAAAVEEHADIVQRYFGQVADFGTRSFVALNTAFVQDGAFVSISDGVVLEQPIQLLFVSSANGAATLTHPRVLVVVGAGSQVRLAETY